MSRAHEHLHGHRHAELGEQAGGDTGHKHTHDHGGVASKHRLVIALSILGGFTAVEAVGGYLANSIALLAEAAHMLADSAALLLAIVAIRVGRRSPDERRTYGHRRYQPLAAFINGQVLLLLTLWVVFEAIRRLMQRPDVNGRWMLAIALIGGIANLAAFLTLSGAGSLNERGALLILAKGWVVADPLLSLLVSALVFRSAWALTRESADVLLQGVPRGFDVKRIEADLIGQVPGLAEIHHIHVWSMTGERPTVTLHAILAPGADHQGVLRAIQGRLSQRLQVEHTTVQIEEPGSCDTPTCGPWH
jgi:cobalt-zinc-cadmium efflux system protein